MAHPWDPIAPPPPRLVRPVRVDPAGLTGPTRAQARGPGWRCASPGLFVPSTVSDDAVEQRIIEAYARAAAGAIVTGWAALRLHGGGFFDGLARDGRTRLPVPLAANGERIRTHPGIDVVRLAVPADEIVVLHGIRCTTVERALFDEVRRLKNELDQVVAIDMAFAAQLTSRRRMQHYRWTRFWYRGVRTLDRVLPLTDEGSRSRPESHFRRIWESGAGWPHPLCNRTVLDLDGQLVGVPDLLDPERCVVGEYAGAEHRNIDQHEDDLERAAAFRRVGLEIVEVVGRDLRRADRVVQRLHEAEERAPFLPQRWQLGPEPPSLDSVLNRRARIVE